MLAVNKLIDDAYEAVNMTGVGESTDGNMSVLGVKELNRAITTLNNEGYIAMTQKWVDAPARRVVTFRKLLEGEQPTPDTVDMAPPQCVVAVARKIGNRFLPLYNGDQIQIATVNPSTTATTWTYGEDFEPVGDEGDMREIGVLTLDGEPRNDVRVWYNSKMPTYKLDDKIYLPDLYNELLMSALCVRLAQFSELSDAKKADLYSDLLAAKTLIKRNSASQRMLQCGKLCGDYRDSYNNGLAGNVF